MNDSTTSQPQDELAHASREEIMAALFANMVIQQTNMAMMLLGKVAHPETGKIVQDVEAAKMFIDQLEMLETKTKGNLSKAEENLLKQALGALHMEFVNVVEAGIGEAAVEGSKEPAHEPAPAPRATTPKSESAPAPEPSMEKSADDDSRKRFSKKY